MKDKRTAVFEASISKHFQFLRSDHGYSKPRFVPSNLALGYAVFEKPPIQIQIIYGGTDCGINFLISHSGIDLQEKFNMEEIISFSTQPKPFAERGYFQATYEKDIDYCVSELAKASKKHSVKYINGDFDQFKALSLDRNSESRKLTSHYKNSQTRRKADKAWRDKNLEQVILLYSSFEEDLDVKEARRLAFAKSKYP